MPLTPRYTECIVCKIAEMCGEWVSETCVCVCLCACMSERLLCSDLCVCVFWNHFHNSTMVFLAQQRLCDNLHSSMFDTPHSIIHLSPPEAAEVTTLRDPLLSLTLNNERLAWGEEGHSLQISQEGVPFWRHSLWGSNAPLVFHLEVETPKKSFAKSGWSSSKNFCNLCQESAAVVSWNSSLVISYLSLKIKCFNYCIAMSACSCYGSN